MIACIVEAGIVYAMPTTSDGAHASLRERASARHPAADAFIVARAVAA